MVVVVGLREGEGGEEGWGGGDGAWGVEKGIGGTEGAVAGCEVGVRGLGSESVGEDCDDDWCCGCAWGGCFSAFWVDIDCSMFRCYGVFVCRVDCFHLVSIIVGCIVVFSRDSFCASE